MVGVEASRIDRALLDDGHVDLRRLGLDDARDGSATCSTADDDNLGATLRQCRGGDPSRRGHRQGRSPEEPSELPAIYHCWCLLPALGCRYRILGDEARAT